MNYHDFFNEEKQVPEINCLIRTSDWLAKVNVLIASNWSWVETLKLWVIIKEAAKLGIETDVLLSNKKPILVSKVNLNQVSFEKKYLDYEKYFLKL